MAEDLLRDGSNRFDAKSLRKARKALLAQFYNYLDINNLIIKPERKRYIEAKLGQAGMIDMAGKIIKQYIDIKKECDVEKLKKLGAKDQEIKQKGGSSIRDFVNILYLIKKEEVLQNQRQVVGERKEELVLV